MLFHCFLHHNSFWAKYSQKTLEEGMETITRQDMYNNVRIFVYWTLFIRSCLVIQGAHILCL